MLTAAQEILAIQMNLFLLKPFILKSPYKPARDMQMHTYNVMVEKLISLYHKKGIDPASLPERDGAIVNPQKLTEAFLDNLNGDGATDGGGDSRTTGASDPEEDPDDVDDADDADTIAAFGKKSEFWKAASKNPKKDPRNQKCWGQWLSDEDMEDAITKSEHNPNADGSPYKITDDNRHLWMGCRRIDPSLSGLAHEPRFEGLIRRIGEHFFLGRKQPDVIRANSNGWLVRVLSPFLHSEPCPNKAVSVINVVLGRAQGGKSYEGVLDCWAKYFVHGVFPAYYVRNGGGLADQAEIVRDFNSFKGDLRAFIEKEKSTYPGTYDWLGPAEIEKLLLSPRLMKSPNYKKKCEDFNCIGIETEIVDCAEIDEVWGKRVASEVRKGGPLQKAIRLKMPQVAIGLMNKSTVQRFTQDGCVLSATIGEPGDGNRIDMDGERYMVGRKELSTKLFETKDSKTKFTPFSLFCGVDSRGVHLRSGVGKQRTREVVFHSAYAPACWDTSQPYDDGINAKRVRFARLLDEVDTSTGEKENHVMNRVNHKDPHIQELAESQLDPEAHKVRKQARAQTDKAVAEDDRCGAELEAAQLREQCMRRGEAVPVTTEEKQEADRVARAGRAAKRERSSGFLFPDETDEEEESEEEGDEEEEEPMDPRWPSEDEEEDSEEGYVDQNKVLERQKRLIDRLTRQKRETEARRKEFELAEQKAMREASGGHVTGMQAAAMYSVGVTATIFGCMQRHIGGKTQVRVTKMPTPDAYNDLQLNGYRLVDPTKPAKAKGDIRVVEAGVKRLGFIDLRAAKHRNAFLRKWMLTHKKATIANGVCIPEDPIKPPSARGSFTIPKPFYEPPESPDEQDLTVSWVTEMMDDFAKARAMNCARMHNSWERNGPLYLYSLNELQQQRHLLKTARRCAQGMVISGETRHTVSKDHLIADLFLRANQDSPGCMDDVCCYNYAGQRLTLYFRPDGDFERMLENIFDDTHECVEKLREYLKGDPTMHYAWIDPNTNQPKSKLDDDWLKKHYIEPIQQVLRHSVARMPVTEAEKQAHKDKQAREEAAGRDASDIPDPMGRPHFCEWHKQCKDATTGKVLGDVTLKSIDFKDPTPQPRYMATLFTLIDACRYHDDPDSFMPTPFVGMTKKAGGRAQRYMCHGHRSRIQVHTHTCDLFPTKKLGICMAEAIQEAFRIAGFDEVERYHLDGEGRNTTGRWMDNWVDQVYVSTEDFVPLLQNALMSQDEWCAMLTKEQRDPQREGETPEAYTKRLNEAPDECLTRVIGGQVAQCLKVALNVWVNQNRVPTTDDMPTTEYPSLHKWLLSHVNNSPLTRNRFLRHSVMDQSEEAIRFDVEHLCRDIVDIERKCAESAIGKRFDEEVEKYEAEHDKENTTPQMEAAARDEAIEVTMKNFVNRIPLPRYSKAHAPGGAIEQRDNAEAAGWEECLQELLARRETINQQWEEKHGKVPFSKYMRDKARKNAERLMKGAQRMREAKVEPDGGPDKYHGYKISSITTWLKQNPLQKAGGKAPPKKERTNEYYYPHSGYIAEDFPELMEVCNAWMAHMIKVEELPEKQVADHRRRAMTAVRYKLSYEFWNSCTGDAAHVSTADNCATLTDELRDKLDDLLQEVALLDTPPKMVTLLTHYARAEANTMAANAIDSFGKFNLYRTTIYREQHKAVETDAPPAKRVRGATSAASTLSAVGKRMQAEVDSVVMQQSMQREHAKDLETLNGKAPMWTSGSPVSIPETNSERDYDLSILGTDEDYNQVVYRGVASDDDDDDDDDAMQS